MKDTKMPDNIPTWISKIADFPGLAPVLMAVIIATLRVVYDKEETRFSRIATEGALCGALALAVHYAVKAAEWNSEWSVFFGAMIGYLGSQYVRQIAMKFIEKKIEK